MTQPPPLTRTNMPELLLWLVGRRRRYQVVERSMLPTLRPGDTVLAQPLNGVLKGGVNAGVNRGMNGAISVNDPVADVAANNIVAKDIVIVRHPTRANLLLIKRVKETFYDGGCYLISDNLAEPTAQDSRHFGVIAAEQLVARVTSLLLPAAHE